MSRLLASLTSLSVVGCCFSPPAPHVGAASASPPPATPVHAPPARAPSVAVEDPLELTQRQSVAISRACASDDDRVAQAEQRYASWVDMDRGPTCRERYVDYGVYSLLLAPACVQRLTEAQTGDAALAAAATAHLASLQRADHLLDDANGYYDRESYRLDACAHGGELHPQLLTAFADFHRTHAALDAVQTEIEDRAISARIARLAADPTRHADFVIETVVDRARRMTRSLQRARLERSRLVVDDEAAVRDAIAAYTAVADVIATEQEVSLELRSRASVLSEDARAVAVRLDGSAFDRDELARIGGGEVFGSPQRVVAHYNALIESYNQL